MAPKEADFIEVSQKRAIEKKTHVSFPQLKYPSLRDEGLKHPVQWLEGKAMDDGAEGLWRVHNRLYDLERFVNNHPGGAEWLELTKGTDITEAFECHHISTVAEKMLVQFYVRDAKTPRNSPFTFEDDGFYRSLKRAVYEELKKLPKDTYKKSDLITDVILTIFCISSALSCWLSDYRFVMASYLTASVALCMLVVATHNYIHQKTNWRMYLFNLSLWSYRDFRVSHALSHHLYPNTLMDLEISAFEPLFNWTPRNDKPFYAGLGIIYQYLIYPFLFFINFTKRFILNFLSKDYFKKHYRWHDAVGFMVPIWMYLVSGASFYDVFVMWVWIICTGSLFFYIVGANAAHHHPKILTDGDEVINLTPDWGMHEVEAVMDRMEINSNYFTVLTLFGNHTLHHLFPTLDHAVLEHLYPVFIKHCTKYEASFRLMSQLSLFLGQHKMLLKKEPTLIKDKLPANYDRYFQKFMK